MYLYKRNFILAASLILSAGAAFPQNAPADTTQEPKQHTRAHDGARGTERVAKALNLTDAQKEQAKAIHEKYRASSEDFRSQMGALREQFKAAKEANNTAELDKLKQQREALFAKNKETWTAERNEFRSILTADQQAKLDQMRKSRRGNGEGKRDSKSEKPQA
jgi:Spy/CpxP family protein refolding chaperone